MRQLEASTVVPAPPGAVFAFLTELENHWEVADRFVDVLSLGGSGGTVRVSGPLGLRRTAVTEVTAVEPPNRLVGSARIGRRTRARVSWTLSEQSAQTRVQLAARVEEAGALDRLLLALGGRLWLERRFASAVRRLAERFSGARSARAVASPASGSAAALRPAPDSPPGPWR